MGSASSLCMSEIIMKRNSASLNTSGSSSCGKFLSPVSEVKLFRAEEFMLTWQDALWKIKCNCKWINTMMLWYQMNKNLRACWNRRVILSVVTVTRVLFSISTISNLLKLRKKNPKQSGDRSWLQLNKRYTHPTWPWWRLVRWVGIQSWFVLVVIFSEAHGNPDAFSRPAAGDESLPTTA